MPRRKASVWDDVSQVAEVRGWWVPMAFGVVCALGIFIGLPLLMAQFITEVGGTGEPARFRSAAGFLAFIFVAAGVTVSIRAAVRRSNRAKLLARTDSLDAVRALTWQEFERLVAAAYEARGYQVHQTPAGADGGVDLVVAKDGLKRFVQCKHSRSRQIGVEKIRELFGVVSSRRASGGVMITAGTLTAPALAAASEMGIEVIDGTKLLSFLGHVPTQTAAPTQAIVSSTANGSAQSCPNCSKPMVERVARKGPEVGKRFWGCTDFPRCRGTRQLNEVEATT